MGCAPVVGTSALTYIVPWQCMFIWPSKWLQRIIKRCTLQQCAQILITIDRSNLFYKKASPLQKFSSCDEYFFGRESTIEILLGGAGFRSFHHNDKTLVVINQDVTESSFFNQLSAVHGGQAQPIAHSDFKKMLLKMHFSGYRVVWSMSVWQSENSQEIPAMFAIRDPRLIIWESACYQGRGTYSGTCTGIHNSHRP